MLSSTSQQAGPICVLSKQLFRYFFVTFFRSLIKTELERAGAAGGTASKRWRRRLRSYRYWLIQLNEVLPEVLQEGDRVSFTNSSRSRHMALAARMNTSNLSYLSKKLG